MSKCYDFNNEGNDIAVIFNHRHVPGKRERVGTEKDRDRLSKILFNYGFQVRCYNDKSAQKITKILEKLSKENHSNTNCLLIFVMTHGGQTQLCSATDGYNIEKLFEPFYNNCLHKKPKFFFIQACRGRSKDLGVEKGKCNKRLDTSETSHIPYAIPLKEDFLVMYSCYGGYVSVREKTGSWFIQAICDELENCMSTSVDMESMLTKASRKVAIKCESANSHTKQMPVICSSLTKKCILKPKPLPYSDLRYIIFRGVMYLEENLTYVLFITFFIIVIFWGIYCFK